jgi:toxin CptA
VVVKPSRILLGLVMLLCGTLGILGLSFLFSRFADIALLFRVIIGLSCVILAGCGFFAVRRGRKTYLLDISGIGQIRLRVLRGSDDAFSIRSEKAAGSDGILVILLADSTIWPRFLMLRLQAEGGYVYNVAILPDSLSSEAFRATSVACRWIAGHDFPP